jgi:hypothetical protein
MLYNRILSITRTIIRLTIRSNARSIIRLAGGGGIGFPSLVISLPIVWVMPDSHRLVSCQYYSIRTSNHLTNYSDPYSY